ncbi:acyltransferase family protein [Oceaniferula spumae]
MSEETKKKKNSDQSQRLVSLDALRGFDMFWIIGGAGLVVALAKVFHLPEELVGTLSEQMKHVQWEGFRFFDLIFPLFVFMSGVAVPYSIIAKLDDGASAILLQSRIIRRAAVLVLIGLSFTALRFQPEQIRLYTVLWLIGMSYLIGASITLHVASWKKRLVIFFGVLIFYHVVMIYLPYPGKGTSLTPHNNLAAWMDRNLIETNLYRGDYDPEGSIRIIPAGMLCLLGALAGEWLRGYGRARMRCGMELLAAGLVCLALGWSWGLVFPIIKDLWSPSFILWSAGWSFLLLALFYIVMDVWKQRWIGWIFLPIGMNSILIYASQWYVPWGNIRDFFFRGYSGTLSDTGMQQLVLLGGLVLVQWLALFWLYRRKAFLSV